MEKIFLTGATGNIGSRIISELLKKNKELYLLVRGNSKKESIKRVEKILEFWNVPLDKIKNVKVLNGNILEKNLGLEKESYLKLSSEINNIIHCAANIKLIISTEDARKIHLEGTKNIVEFSKECIKNGNFKRLNYLSTMEVAGDMKGIVPEDFIKTKRNFLNNYEMGKAETENFLEEEIKKGLPLTIYRPSMVIGDSKTGKILKFSTFYHTLEKSVLNPPSGIVPVKDSFYLDLIPVDFVSESICRLYNSPKSKNKIYNLVAGKNKSLIFKDFVEFSLIKISEITKKPQPKIKFLPPSLIKPILKLALFFSFGKARKKLKFQLIMINFLFLKQEFANNNLRKDLKGIEIPNFKNYAEKILRYYLENKD